MLDAGPDGGCKMPRLGMRVGLWAETVQGHHMVVSDRTNRRKVPGLVQGGHQAGSMLISTRRVAYRNSRQRVW